MLIIGLHLYEKKVDFIFDFSSSWFFVCCNEQSNKLEDLLANLEKKGDTNEFEKNKLLWESVIKKVWLKETWNSSETYEDMSFVITRVEKSKLWGAFFEKRYLKTRFGFVFGKTKS